jgi:cation diffusion facilitator CzcD-associated flavoprotein CzcO
VDQGERPGRGFASEDWMTGGPIRTRVIVIGAGFGGIGLGIRFKQSGLNDFIILERAEAIGGVWRDNHYPGAACDVPSHLYSFSFEPHADWPDRYANQADILDYLERCARKHDLHAHVRFGHEVTQACWDETTGRWTLGTRHGETFEAQAVVTATGQLSQPKLPALPGLGRFTGPVFHSAAWRHDTDMRGKRIAVIGTGASAIQFVPAIAPLAARLSVFQRSAPYVLPKSDKVYPRWQKRLFERLPVALLLSRALNYLAHEAPAFALVFWPAALRIKRGAFLRHLSAGVSDPERRRNLLPRYRIGCKRILLSNDFYPAMDRPNVELVTDAIKEVTAGGIVTADGVERRFDCIVFGTGFAASDFLAQIKITATGGANLHQGWRDGADAHLGITVAGFPNFFMIYGPNTNLAHNSIIYMQECQIGYVIACIKRLLHDGIRALEIKPEVQQRSNAWLRQRLKNTVWARGCSSWYLTPDGKNTSNWPGYTLEFWLKTRAPKWDEYVAR